MFEKEVIGDAVLYCGDCREILDSIEPVDVVISDPVWPNCPAGLLAGSDEPEKLLKETLEHITAKRLVLVVRSDSDPRFFRAVPDTYPFFRAQILPYVMPGYIGRKLGGDEFAYCFGDPIPSAPGKRVIPGYAPKVQPNGRKANGHPCSRSLEHFQWLMKWWTVDGDTVLDPFMGSGTTGVAAASANRKFIGIEIEREYFDLACRQIEKANNWNGMPLSGVKSDYDARPPALCAACGGGTYSHHFNCALNIATA